MANVARYKPRPAFAGNGADHPKRYRGAFTHIAAVGERLLAIGVPVAIVEKHVQRLEAIRAERDQNRWAETRGRGGSADWQSVLTKHRRLPP